MNGDEYYLLTFFVFSCAPKQRSHFSSPHFIDNNDEDDDDRDYFVVRKKPKVRPKKKKITIELDDYDDVVKFDNNDNHEAYTPPHIPFKKRNRLAKQRLRTRYLRGKRRGKRRRKYLLRKKLIWDRNFGEPDDIADDYVDETDDFDDNDNDDQIFLRTKDQNSRFDGSYGIKDIPQQSLDRNYGTMFENLNSHTFSSKNNRRIPGEYLNVERDDIFQFNQNPDMYMRSENINFEENSNRRSDTIATDGYMGRQLKAPTNSLEIDRENKPTSNFSRRSDLVVSKPEGRKFGKEKAVFDMPGRFRRVYSKWSKWSKCSAKCTTRRFK